MSRYASLAFALVIAVAGACSGESEALNLPGTMHDAGSILLAPESNDAGVSYAADAMAWGDPFEPPPAQGELIENDFVNTSEETTSTFGIDVDTGSYTLSRRALNEGQLPDPDSVRVEEFINYFAYAYTPPSSASERPFAIDLEMAPSPFGVQGTKLLRVGLKGYEVPADQRKPANLVFLIDVSGSMGSSDKLPWVKELLRGLTETLQPTDTLGIVTYASGVREVLQPTAVENKSVILDAITELQSGGSTAGAGGIQAAYAMAESAKQTGSINRVVLCTDGDFNVGITGDALVDWVSAKRDEGITLSVFGFGMGNYKDVFLEQLADNGDGNYAYIDSSDEIQRVLSESLIGMLQVIAKDVKVQLVFDETIVSAFRLVGYENRVMPNQDFVDDTKDGGEIGAGHTVTAFYELKLHDQAPGVGKVATVRLRYKEPDGDTSKLIEHTLVLDGERATFAEASEDFRFAAAVVELAEVLRVSKHSEGARFDEVIEIARATAGDNAYRLELVALAEIARGLWPEADPQTP
ncbi:MAG: von Willebrand factor type A domain-containing protein [Deltaproteobacteria bacterium]|nr:von Willebrand factor type A domain-containing protein [Deltaproteobacteria bacterium]